MIGEVYWHGILRKYIVAVGTLFNDVHIERLDENGRKQGDMKVPLTYAPREKVLSRLEQNLDLQKQAITLPRMSFEMINMSYAPDRKLQTMQRHTKTSEGKDADKKLYLRIPVPYEINMQLNIYVKYLEDGQQIVEQILPYFTPEWTFTLTLIDEMPFPMDIPLVLQSVISEDTHDGSFETRRQIIWTMDFMLKGYLFGPTIEEKIIKQAEINAFVDNMFTSPNVKFNVRPGLTANGAPTSVLNNSVPLGQIEGDDNYGVITTIESLFPL